jgi:hypothetical protein
MNVKTSILLFALLVLTAGATIVLAGTSGKIAGRVTDASTGSPLVGANILLKGTPMGAASDLNGNFIVLNIPPGAYTVTVSNIGYRSVQYQNVRVNVDLTTQLAPALEPSAVELDAVVVTAERKLIVKDMTSSLSTISADQIESLPVDNLQQVLRLTAGIVESGGQLHMRGGRGGEIAFWVDGISSTDVFNGNMGTTVENSAIQEIQVVSGTFNAEYGQAMSGIVNIITKEGGSRYIGQVKVYGGDYISNDDKFGVYKSIQTVSDSTVEGLTNIVSSERDHPLKKINPIFNGELSLSGPVPLTGEKIMFFVNGRYYSNEGFLYGRNWFKPNGTPGDSSLVPMNGSKSMSAQIKLNMQPTSAIKLNYNLFWNRYDTDREFQHDYRYDPYGTWQTHTIGMTHMATLSHMLSQSTYYELRVSHFNTQTKQYVWADPYTSNTYLVNIIADDTKGILAETFDPSTTTGQIRLDSIKALGGRYEYVPDPNGPVGYIDPQTINAPASYSFLNKGMNINNTAHNTSYWVGKVDLTSQILNSHQLKVGMEARLHDLIFHGFQIIPRTDETGQVLTPFMPAIPAEGSLYRNDYERKPREISAYIQDKTEFNDVIVNIGLRYDYFDPNSVRPTDPEDPNIFSPFKNNHIYANWTDMPAEYPGTIDKYIADQLASGAIHEYTPNERRAFMQTKVKAKMALSPRLGIAFPITDRGVIHFSYGHFFQIPQFQFLYADPDFKLSSGSGNTLFGNADLKPQKTVMYEIGLQQQLSDDVSVDFALFYRDVRDWVGTSPLVTTANTSVAYSTYENKDYENVRGITVKIEKRFTGNFMFRVDYTFQKAEGTYSNPADAYNAQLNNQAPVLALLPMNWDQTHTLNGQFIVNISQWTFSLIGRYWSGLPYTPSFPVAEQVGAATVSGLTQNSARLPDQKTVDLTINRSFKLGSSITLELFAYVYNLLDQRDATTVYGDTGSPDYTTTINPNKIPYTSTRVSTVQDFVNQPTWYSAPRRVEVGVVLGF